MSKKSIYYYGIEESLPERISLRAGPLTLYYEQGGLRYIKWGDREVIRRIYVAIRDRNWGTVLPLFSNLKMDIQLDSFHISYQVENIQEDINFAWVGEITGSPQGEIFFHMEGTARSTFLRNRIGFCVLYPASCAGEKARIEHIDGTVEQGSFPELICPDQPVLPFAEFRKLAHLINPEIWAEVSFSGDIFEMEDQRNWTDASYKIFSTPLRLPYPVQVEAGTRITQSISLAIRSEFVKSAPVKPITILEEPAPVSFTIYPGKTYPLPYLGLGVASHGHTLIAREIERLKALRLDHLRVDLQLDTLEIPDQLQRAAGEAVALGIALEAALLVGDAPDEGFAALKEELVKLKPPIKTWLVYPLIENFLGRSPTRRVLEEAHQHLDGIIPEARFGGGTNTDLIFMLRTPPPLDLIDLVTYAVNPQVHAFDNASIVENLPTQGTTVRTARQLSGGKPVYVSPVTLKPRFNAYATAPTLPPQPGELPPQVDPRQMSLLGAGWTAASLKYLTESGAQSVTYFETTGWRGVMETTFGSPIPQRFHSKPSRVFPLYHVLADYGEFSSGTCVQSISSAPLQVDGIALQKEGKLRRILANFTAKRQAVTVHGVGDCVQIRRLDETTARQAIL